MDKPPIVIDLGSNTIKAGFAGESAPRCSFPSVVGRPKNPGIMFGAEHKDYYVGSLAMEKRGVLKLNYPIEHGVIEDWDDLEKLLEHCFTNELRVAHSEYQVLLTEPPLNPVVNRERLTQLMFDTFRVSGLFVANTSVLATYAAGKPTGVVVDSGGGGTHVVPVFDGYALSGSTMRLDLAGRDITDYLNKLLNAQGCDLTTSAEQAMVGDIKEKHGRISLDFERELTAGAFPSVPYELPDSTVLQLGSELFRAPEILLNPALIGREYPGLSQQIHSAILKSDSELRAELFANIILSGGSTAFPGLAERLTAELRGLAPPALRDRVRIIAVPERKHATWIGGSILASTSDFGVRWMTQDEYSRQGSSLVLHKCV